ncbi:hypothetical protein AAC387_Pa03g3221 [Persea americana]
MLLAAHCYFCSWDPPPFKVFFVLPKPRIPPSIISSHGNHLDHMLLLYSLMPYIETVKGNQQSLSYSRCWMAKT